MINNSNKLKKHILLILNSLWRLQTFSFLIAVFFIISCNGQNQTKSRKGETNYLSSEQLLIKNPQYGFNNGLLDSEGVLWFTSNGSGIYRYDRTSFSNFSETNGLCNNQVYSMIEDKEGVLWFGTGNGLCRYDRKTFTHVPIPFSDTSSVWLDKVYPIINPNAVHSLIQDKKGDIWIGTGGGGAYKYDGEKFTPYLSKIGTKQTDSLYHNWIPSITEDTEGSIWFASMTHGGVSRYKNEKFTHFMPNDGLSDDMVRTIFKDKSGNIWFGFNGNRNSGLTFYDGKSFNTFSKKEGLCNTSIQSIYEDKKGKLWLGSGRGNLCIFDGKNFKEFISKEGKTFSEILFILGDLDGSIWFGGKNGLWKLDGESIIDMTK